MYDNLIRFIRFQMDDSSGSSSRSSARPCSTSSAGSHSCRSRRCGSTSPSTLFQAIGLGYGQPCEGLMQAPPRPKAQPIMPRGLMMWLVTVGVVIGVGTLACSPGAKRSTGEPVARTMGVITSPCSACSRRWRPRTSDESLFGGSILANRPLLMATGMSVLRSSSRPSSGFLQQLLGTVEPVGRPVGSSPSGV